MVGEVKNILFIMCDQLRHDYLSCSGHPHLQTPNIDALAARGVRFSRTYVQSPVCGSSRMSFYTGRYVHSHGASYNQFPLKVGEMTMGDYLRPLGRRTVLVGKTHMVADEEGMARLGIAPDTTIGVLLSECGFEPFERDDGLHPHGPLQNYGGGGDLRYNQYLRDLGYDSENPWNDFANAAEGEDGSLLSGWFLKNSRKAARVREEHSETPYMTRRAMAFIDSAGEEAWCLHLSYIKPHWPYIVPSPYHALYGDNHVPAATRSEAERQTTHPLFGAFMQHRVSLAFARDEVRQATIPAYMGLIKQIDDQLGLLFEFLEQRGLFENTMIVFTSDHGDYLGDHWLGDKDFFHAPSVLVPLIIYDPRREANAARGTICDELVESIDLLPTFIDACGGEAQPHRLEGLSLAPWLHGIKTPVWRNYAISEYDYSGQPAASEFDIAPLAARMFMVADKQFKYIAFEGFRPMLFDLENDPDELVDLGEQAEFQQVRDRMQAALSRWALRWSQRTTISDEQIIAARGSVEKVGILIGYWDIDELSGDLKEAYKKILHTS